jgi:hypothetical protein
VGASQHGGQEAVVDAGDGKRATSCGELLDPVARETNVSSLQKRPMMRGAWETNMPEREITVTRRGEEPLDSVAQEGRQNGAAAEQQLTAADEREKEKADLQARLAAAVQQLAAMVARTESPAMADLQA